MASKIQMKVQNILAISIFTATVLACNFNSQNSQKNELKNNEITMANGSSYKLNEGEKYLHAKYMRFEMGMINEYIFKKDDGEEIRFQSGDNGSNFINVNNKKIQLEFGKKYEIIYYYSVDKVGRTNNATEDYSGNEILNIVKTGGDFEKNKEANTHYTTPTYSPVYWDIPNSFEGRFVDYSTNEELIFHQNPDNSVGVIYKNSKNQTYKMIPLSVLPHDEGIKCKFQAQPGTYVLKIYRACWHCINPDGKLQVFDFPN